MMTSPFMRQQKLITMNITLYGPPIRYLFYRQGNYTCIIPTSSLEHPASSAARRALYVADMKTMNGRNAHSATVHQWIIAECNRSHPLSAQPPTNMIFVDVNNGQVLDEIPSSHLQPEASVDYDSEEQRAADVTHANSIAPNGTAHIALEIPSSRLQLKVSREETGCQGSTPFNSCLTRFIQQLIDQITIAMYSHIFSSNPI